MGWTDFPKDFSQRELKGEDWGEEDDARKTWVQAWVAKKEEEEEEEYTWCTRVYHNTLCPAGKDGICQALRRLLAPHQGDHLL